MKITAASALCGATAVAALTVPSCHKRSGLDNLDNLGEQITDTFETIGEVIEELIMLPLEQFGLFDTLSLEDAKAGIIKQHSHHNNSTTTSTITNLTPTSSTAALFSAQTHMPDASNVKTATPKTGNTAAKSGNNAKTTTNNNSNSTIVDNGSSASNTTTTASPAATSSAAASNTTVNNSTNVDNSTDGTMTTQSVVCDNPNVRFEWRDYSDTDRHAFVDAVKCLMKKPSAGDAYSPSTSRYEDIVRVHQMMTNTIHGNNIFLFWHRYYTWTLEQIMRDECGFDRAFPWWDETKDAGAFNQSSIFTSDFFGSLPAATNGQGTCITDGVCTH
jgi:hypothetical protein